MYKLNNKFAIGCLVQWYEIEIVEEYVKSVKKIAVQEQQSHGIEILIKLMVDVIIVKWIMN